MKIKVTQQDIEKGDPGDCESCAMALALRCHIKVNQTLEVNVSFEGRASVFIDGVTYNLSKSCYMFIRDFDNKEPVKPFSFELEIPIISNLSAQG